MLTNAPFNQNVHRILLKKTNFHILQGSQSSTMLWTVADLEIAGGGDVGSEQSAAQRPPDDRRREAPEVVRGVGSGGGRPRPPPVRGFGGITPEKILKFYIAKDAF